MRHVAFATGNMWVVEQSNSANNAWYVNGASSFNTNNKTNSNQVWPCAEYERLVYKFFEAEYRCFENKKSKWDANRFHYHLALLIPIIQSVLSGTYIPSPNKCFILSYPVWRECFAAYYPDRTVHHFIVPYILEVSEKVHRMNGNLSHGNRPGQSILTATEQLQKQMQEHPNGIVYKFDIQGFFMNIDREFAFKVFLYFEQRFRPEGYSEMERLMIIETLYKLLTFDPTQNCIIKSPEIAWTHIKKEKTLFGKIGIGLPIGNFYVQVIAVLKLALVDMFLQLTHLVDDYVGVEDSEDGVWEHKIEKVRAKLALAREILNALGLTMHPKKLYIQPVRHGVPFCGRFVFGNRVYISNRTIHAINYRLYRFLEGPINEDTSLSMLNSFNSYTGQLKFLTEYNTQMYMEKLIGNSDFRKYVYFKHKKNQIICKLKEEYKPLNKSDKAIKYLDKQLKHYRYGRNYHRTHCGLSKASKKIK